MSQMLQDLKFRLPPPEPVAPMNMKTKRTKTLTFSNSKKIKSSINDIVLSNKFSALDNGIDTDTPATTLNYSDNVNEIEITKAINDMQVDDEFPSLNDSMKINDSKKRPYIPPIVVDKVNNGKNLMDELNVLTNGKVTARVVTDKLKIFPPSAEAHRLIRSEITDKRKLQTHTFLLPQDKQLKIVIRGLPHDYPTTDLVEDHKNESFHIFCSRNPVCVKCAGPHKSGNCPKPKDSPACCALCKDAHTANYSGCLRNPANFVPAPPLKFNVWEERLNDPKLRINLQHPTSANNIPPSTSVTEIHKLITSPSENNQSASNAPLSNNQDILIIKTLLQDVMSKFSTALEALPAQKSSKSNIQ
ncbi:nucleic-acid-binding protein from transposon X-element [Caerostris extrusa]|uniref:Nucleic-acid-binding protein from transposon X-element n=1 Tax=Caerostris extrusa TaxID=172846 RepID=A0AAV4WXH5_CAEEX|nr:nucleic-acid-binding protein from transposon X-element [Caerostris extrusa]